MKPEGATRNDVVRILSNSIGGLHHFISHFSTNDATYIGSSSGKDIFRE